MTTRESLRFRFWRDVVPIATTWTFSALLMIAGAVLIVGIFTAPLGVMLIAWLAGRSYVKHWSKADDRRTGGRRN